MSYRVQYLLYTLFVLALVEVSWSHSSRVQDHYVEELDDHDDFDDADDDSDDDDMDFVHRGAWTEKLRPDGAATVDKHAFVDYNEEQVVPLSEMTVSKRTKYPELYTFNPHLWLHADRLEGVLYNITEVAPDIYAFRLFNEDFCRKLIEEVEMNGKWVSDDSDAGSDLDVTSTKAKSIRKIPSHKRMDNAFYHMTMNYITPIINHVWKSFDPRILDTQSVLKYDENGMREMELHYDAEKVAMVGYLNNNYTGGGTLWPRLKFNFQDTNPEVGTFVIYPGSLTHEHKGVRINSGTRYVFLGAYF